MTLEEITRELDKLDRFAAEQKKPLLAMLEVAQENAAKAEETRAEAERDARRKEAGKIAGLILEQSAIIDSAAAALGKALVQRRDLARELTVLGHAPGNALHHARPVTLALSQCGIQNFCDLPRNARGQTMFDQDTRQLGGILPPPVFIQGARGRPRRVEA